MSGSSLAFCLHSSLLCFQTFQSVPLFTCLLASFFMLSQLLMLNWRSSSSISSHFLFQGLLFGFGLMNSLAMCIFSQVGTVSWSSLMYFALYDSSVVYPSSFTGGGISLTLWALHRGVGGLGFPSRGSKLIRCS